MRKSLATKHKRTYSCSKNALEVKKKNKKRKKNIKKKKKTGEKVHNSIMDLIHLVDFHQPPSEKWSTLKKKNLTPHRLSNHPSKLFLYELTPFSEGKNISEDTKEMPQSRSTALPRYQRKER